MAEYWKNKYPVKFDNPTVDIPVGTTFTVTGICENQFELTAMDESKGYSLVIIDLDVLLSGFTCSDKIMYQSFMSNHSSLLDQIAEYVRKNKHLMKD